MLVELRYATNEKGERVVRGLCLICEGGSASQESEKLDAVFGSSVGKDGLIGTGKVECRLSDGYDKHYLYIPTVTG